MFSVVETFAWRRIVCTVLGSACVRINSVAHRCRSECTVTCGKPLRSVSLSSHSLIVLGFSGVPSYCDTQNCVNALQCTYQQCVLPGCRAAIFLAGRHAPCQRTGGGAVGRPDCKLQCYGVRYRRKAVPYFCDFAPAALGRAFLP